MTSVWIQSYDDDCDVGDLCSLNSFRYVMHRFAWEVMIASQSCDRNDMFGDSRRCDLELEVTHEEPYNYKELGIEKNISKCGMYHANRMLSFYAPGWCGEIRDVIYSDNGSVTVVYRVTVRGTDGEVHRESTGTVFLNNGKYQDPVAAAEEVAFRRACARFGLGLHLYHED
ncbi:uncharacterized protein A4U43_C09F15980 [Asparagus officinalis]|uniref:Uncharacterized protein n=1 Tax=Asparagus officinalis TaxID=4686 RepID=A0A5P1E7V8_ASPOF|nr:uncharacterized protein A4U43_C09F15980 [Asparagus officinalis]